MKFSPCTSQCTSEGIHCEGCGRSHLEIQETQAITKLLVAHLVKYDYDDPEKFLENINNKAIKRSKKIKEENNG
ncbi:DUF1289 domain-containing protein [Psychromonas sp. RZ22]|uniref:DUF1289 domain-containing protein n=1 Tax=Psychromonas algarum TaxID=2555643 RepID=UPI001067F042|nr:DUF1289 domain-containing protein [Psychromonas sp. RZ22]TEW53978.1 DUF1289 domain-containing protein [Psychromonas sp. RZ22]